MPVHHGVEGQGATRAKALVLGHTGFLGAATMRRLSAEGFEAFGASRSTGTDIRSSDQARRLLDDLKPRYVFNCAAVVGGIAFGPKNSARILRDNALQILGILDAIVGRDVELISPVSNCAYPGSATVFHEEEFWKGAVHPSVEAYGSVRRFGIAASMAYRAAHGVVAKNLILPNLYGPGDHLDPVRAHALGAITSRIVTADIEGVREVSIWGSGAPIREWMHVDDAAAALVSATRTGEIGDFINVGVGEGVSVKELAEMIARAVGYSGSLHFDTSKPDGAPKKLMAAPRAASVLGWKPTVSLESGILETAADYRLRILADRNAEGGPQVAARSR